MSAAARPPRPTRADFVRFVPIPTRWADNDVYGHVNNVQYYAFFDTAVNSLLISEGVLDIARSPVIGLVVETTCTYYESITYPEVIEVGVAMERIGTSSLTYRLAIFRSGQDLAAAQGRFTHVHVDRASQKPVALPETLRRHAEKLTPARP